MIVLKRNGVVVGRGESSRLAIQDAIDNGYQMGPFVIEALSCGRGSFKDKKGLWELSEDAKT